MKAVIFDMDGVIIDSEPIHARIEKGLLEELGGHISDEEYLKYVGMTDEAMWSSFKENYDLKPSVDDLIATKKERFMEEIHNVPLVEDFKEVLDAFYENGCKIALASSNNKVTVDKIIKEFSLSSYFETAISGEEITHGKPHPEIFLTAADHMDVEPKECLVFEDATNGVEAAKAAGMKCIGLDNPNSGEQDLSEADWVIDTFEDLNIEQLKTDFDKWYQESFGDKV